MKRYYRIYLGEKHKYADLCRKEGFICIGSRFNRDFKDDFCDNITDFNKKFVPLLLKEKPELLKRQAIVAVSRAWRIGEEIKNGDIILSPRKDGVYMVGEISGSYFYSDDGKLPHRRSVKWYSTTLNKESMTDGLCKLLGNPGTIREVTKYEKELEMLIKAKAPNPIISTDQDIEDPSCFAMEKHLEDFLIANWGQTELGKKYDICSDDEGAIEGQQYKTDTGSIDILAISKDEKEWLVIELKKGRVSDAVVGQIQRYMGYVKEELAEDGQRVKGIIIALENDLRIRRALSVVDNIDFYRYKIKFSLAHADN